MKQLKGYRAAEKPTEQDLTKKYEGLSQDELHAELMRSVAAAKQNGEFSETMLDDFVTFVSPNLDPAARAKLEELVRAIKNS